MELAPRTRGSFHILNVLMILFLITPKQIGLQTADDVPETKKGNNEKPSFTFPALGTTKNKDNCIAKTLKKKIGLYFSDYRS
jgi:hypothetical protein